MDISRCRDKRRCYAGIPSIHPRLRPHSPTLQSTLKPQLNGHFIEYRPMHSMWYYTWWGQMSSKSNLSYSHIWLLFLIIIIIILIIRNLYSSDPVREIWALHFTQSWISGAHTVKWSCCAACVSVLRTRCSGVTCMLVWTSQGKAPMGLQRDAGTQWRVSVKALTEPVWGGLYSLCACESEREWENIFV